LPRIDLDALRAYRQVEPLADAYRKPGCHGSIRHRNHPLRAPEHAADPWPVSRPQRVPDAQTPPISTAARLPEADSVAAPNERLFVSKSRSKC
jgi:hypothetical protein